MNSLGTEEQQYTKQWYTCLGAEGKLLYKDFNNCAPLSVIHPLILRYVFIVYELTFFKLSFATVCKALEMFLKIRNV